MIERMPSSFATMADVADQYLLNHPDYLEYLRVHGDEAFVNERKDLIKSLERSVSPEYLEGTFQKYCNDLDLDHSDFSKKILDVGALDGAFSRQAEKLGLNSEIISLDPKEANLLVCTKNKIIATAEDIPVDDETFDIAISHNSLPLLVSHGKDGVDRTLSVLREMLRVTKKGGQVRVQMYCADDQGEGYNNVPGRQNILAALSLLKDEGFIIDIVEKSSPSNTSLPDLVIIKK